MFSRIMVNMHNQQETTKVSSEHFNNYITIYAVGKIEQNTRGLTDIVLSALLIC